MRSFVRGASLLLAFLFILASFPFFTSADGKTGKSANEEVKSAAAALDFADPADPAPKSVAFASFALDRAGVTLTEGETELFGGASTALRYTDVIPFDRAECRRIEGGVTVTAKNYSYKSASGNTVEYTPYSATVEGETKRFKADRTLSFVGLEGGKVYEVSIEYRASIDISSGAAEEMFNAGYRLGTSARSRSNAYENALSAYNDRTAEYTRIYETYLNAQAAYDLYVRAYENYLSDKRDYEEYIAQKNAYEEALIPYRAYLEAKQAYDEAAAAYAIDYAAYAALYPAYLENAAQVARCREAVAAFNTVYIDDGAGHVMSKTILGSTVDTVMQNKKRIVEEGGADKRDVDNAGAATDALRVLLPSYQKLKTEKEKFDYYKEHYEEIRSNFVLLFTSLYSLGKNSVVRAVLIKNEKWERYCQFVAHLYLVHTCLDDTRIHDPEWKMREYAQSELLGEAIMIEDKQCSDPSDCVFPDEILTQPEAPVMPVAPEVVKEPVKTWTVELTEPTEPDKVEKPEKPVSESEYVGSKPTPPVLTDTEKALMAETDAGTLKKRSVSGISFTLTSVMTKQVVYEGMASVRFYDYDRTTLLWSQVVFKGESVSYHGKTPARESDARYTYRFTGFVDAQGKEASLKSITESVDFFAAYEETPIIYTVVFRTHGEEQSLSYVYDETPVPTLSTESYFEGDVEYRFAGYTPQISPVRGNAEYTAVYDRIEPERFTVVFVDGEQKTVSILKKGETPTAPETRGSYTDERYSYVFEGFDPQIVPADGDAVYTAVYTRAPLAPMIGQEGTARVLEAESVTMIPDEARGAYDIRYPAARALELGKDLTFVLTGVTITLKNEALNKLENAYSLSAYADGDWLSLSVRNEAGDDLLAGSGIEARFSFRTEVRSDFKLVFASGEDDSLQVPFALDNGEVLASLPKSGRYLFLRPHAITVLGENVVPSAGRACRGETVTVSPIAGTKGTIGSLKVTYEGNGQTKTVLGDSFVMPDENVTVEAVFATPPTVTVTFYDADGQILQKNTYAYDDPVSAPPAPAKDCEEEGYEYVFVEWTPELLPRAVEDREYRPVYKKATKAPYESPYDSDRFWSKVFFPKILPIFLGTVALIAGAIFLTIRLIKRHKRKKEEATGKED